MIFSSPVFLFLFLPLTLLGVAVVRREFRNFFLLAASLVFYAWGEAEFVLLMVLSIFLNYLFGHLIHTRREHGKLFVGLAVAANLALLSFFKYASFLAGNLNAVFNFLQIPPLEMAPVHLPIGISFFTFHAISYIVDIYRRDAAPSHSPVDFALYIALFPQLIAGPIIRYRDINLQLADRSLSLDKFASGVNRFILGLGKKVLIAGVLAKAADFIFGLPAAQLTWGLAWTGIVSFALQVYFDFSAYSDMAIGLGRMFGFEIKENFDYPFIAQSIREFWHRWHISLSTWFRDYLYISLGGSRVSAGRVYFNLFAVFFLCGLWHGASWNFITLGMIHGSFMVLERLGLGALLERCWRPVRHAYALLVIMVSFVFFRAADFPQALAVIRNMAGLGAWSGSYPFAYFATREFWLAGIVALAGSLPLFPRLAAHLHQPAPRCARVWGNALAYGAPAGYAAFLFAVFVLSAMSLASGLYAPFIYFRF